MVVWPVAAYTCKIISQGNLIYAKVLNLLGALARSRPEKLPSDVPEMSTDNCKSGGIPSARCPSGSECTGPLRARDAARSVALERQEHVLVWGDESTWK